MLSTRYAIAVRPRDTDDRERATVVFGGVAARQRPMGEQHPHTGWAWNRLALSERDAGRTDQALEQLAIVHTTWTNRFGPDSQLAPVQSSARVRAYTVSAAPSGDGLA